MKRQLLFASVIFAASCLSLQAADIVGTAGPLVGGGSVDGWSGITVMDGEGNGSVGAGQSVSAYNYYADGGRADGNHSVQGLVIQKAGDAFSIWDVGPVHTPTAEGEYSVAWEGKTVPADGNSYHAAFWQWNEGVNNTDGGLVPFGGDTGHGMFQADRDGTTYVPAVGDEVDMGHASGAGGRGYQFNLATVPEPSSIVLTLLAVAGFTCLVRRK